MASTKILFVGDVFGSPGRRVFAKVINDLRSGLEVHLVVVNAENAAGGLGITEPTAKALFEAGADVITLGNHTFAKRDVGGYLDDEIRILRPANYPPGVPGRGWGIFKASNGENVVVISLMGRTFMTPIDCPFRAVDDILGQLDDVRLKVVDIHAEATSEKVAMGWYLDGRVSAVLGTHTHVQTSDERVLPCGTAYISDLGLTGVHDSILGMDIESVINRFITQVPFKFKIAEGHGILQGVVVEMDSNSGRAIGIERLSISEIQ